MVPHTVLSIALGVISFMLLVQSLVAIRFIRKCRKQRTAIDEAYYSLVGVDGSLPHDVGRIVRARKVLLDELTD